MSHMYRTTATAQHTLHINVGWRVVNNLKHQKIIMLLFTVDYDNSILSFILPFFGFSIPHIPHTPRAYLQRWAHDPGSCNQRTPSPRPQWLRNRHVTQLRPIRVLLGNFLLKLTRKILFSLCYSVGRIKAIAICATFPSLKEETYLVSKRIKVQREAKSEIKVSHISKGYIHPLHYLVPFIQFL